MALFRYGFTIQSNSQSDSVNCDTVPSIPASFPSQENTSLYCWVSKRCVCCRNISRWSWWREEFLSYSKKERELQPLFTWNTCQDWKVCWWKWQFESVKTIQGRSVPNLKESTVRSFKQACERKLKEVRKKRNVEAQVLAIPSDTLGRPPSILLELDAKLISLLKSMRSRGGVINFSVVKATALALVKSNRSSSVTGFQHTTRVRSVYRRCGFSRRAGTTTRHPVPRRLFEECELTFLSDINRRQSMNIRFLLIMN